MSRATVDIQAVRFFLGYGLIFFFQHVFTVVGVTIIVFLISWKLALIALAFSPILVAVAYHYSNVSHPVLRDVQQKMADVATVAEENVVGVHVVKSFAQEQAEQDKFERRTETLFDQSVTRQPAARVLRAGARLPAAARPGRGAVRRRAHGRERLDVGRPVRLVQPLPRDADLAAAHARHVDRRGPARDRVGRADLPGDRRARGRSATQPDAVELPAGPGPRAASRASRSATTRRGRSSRGSTSSCEPGKTVALIGHTGSGKTTLASLIPRFYDVQAGRVTIDGADVRELTLNSLRREIGAIAQDPFLFSATVRENLAFGRADATDEQVEQAARLAQAHEFIERLPEGYETVIGERGITLSGGQRQRVAIARALVVDPRILILDDATASVDATTEAKIRLGLHEAMRGPDDGDHRPPPVDDRPRRRDRRPRPRPRRRARHARRPRRRRARSTARSGSTAGSSTRSSPSRRWRSHARLAAGQQPRRAPRVPRCRTGRGRRRSGG